MTHDYSRKSRVARCCVIMDYLFCVCKESKLYLVVSTVIDQDSLAGSEHISFTSTLCLPSAASPMSSHHMLPRQEGKPKKHGLETAPEGEAGSFLFSMGTSSCTFMYLWRYH